MPIVGIIAAVTVAAIYGQKAVTMKNKMKGIQELIDTNDGTLRLDRTLGAELCLITVSLIVIFFRHVGLRTDFGLGGHKFSIQRDIAGHYSYRRNDGSVGYNQR